MYCGKLMVNSHLFSLQLIKFPDCIWAYNLQDKIHYLSHCLTYILARHKTFNAMFSHINVQNVAVDTLVYGLGERKQACICEAMKT